MKRDYLEKLGLEKDAIDAILDEHGKEIGELNTRLRAKDTEIGTLRGDLTTAANQAATDKATIDELRKVDVESIKTELAAEKAGREADRRRYKATELLHKAGCTDTEYLLYKAGKDIKYDDNGEIIDADATIKNLKETYGQHFGAGSDDKGAHTGSAGNFGGQRRTGGTKAEDNPYTRVGWNLTKQWALEASNPEEAKRLKEEAKS